MALICLLQLTLHTKRRIKMEIKLDKHKHDHSHQAIR